MELDGIKNRIKGVLGAIGREMDRWGEADRRLGNRILTELNPPQASSLLSDDLSIMGSQCQDYGARGVMDRARESRAQQGLYHQGQRIRNLYDD
jgi:hypothetical protein